MDSGTLKPGWTRVAFGEMAACVNDRIDTPAEAGVEHYVGLEHLDPDSLAIRRWGSPSDVSATKLRFRKGDIIFGRRRVYQRKVAVADFDGICSAHAMVLIAKPAVVASQFLPFFMQSDLFMERAKTISVGSLSPTINWKTLAKQEFALPPLDEQRRIAEVLYAAEAAIESLRTLSVRIVETRFAHLNEFFKPRFAQVLPLPEVATSASGGTPSKSKAEYWGGDLPWASGKDLKVRSLSTTELQLTAAGWSVAKTAPERSTLIVVRGMILAHTFPVAQCAVPMAFNQDLRALTAKDGMSPDYLTLWFEWAGQWFLARTSESSHGTKRLDSEIFEDALVPSPSLEVQQGLIDSQLSFLEAEKNLRQRQSQVLNCKAALLRESVEVGV